MLDRLLVLSVLLLVLATHLVFSLLLVVFDNRLFFELTNVSGQPFEVGPQLSDLRVRFKQILRIEISVRPDLLVKVELKLKLCLSLEILLLELGNEIVLQLDLFKALVVLCVSKSSLVSIDFLVLLKLDVLLTELLHGDGIGLLLESNFEDLLLVHLHLVLSFAFSLLLSDEIAIEQLSLMDLGIDLLLLVVDFALHVLLNGRLLFEFEVLAVFFLRDFVSLQTRSVGLTLNDLVLLCELAKFFIGLAKVSLVRLIVRLVLVERGLLPILFFLSVM